MKSRTAMHCTAPHRPPGYYSALIRQHDWPPRFEPRMPSDMEQWRSINAAANRARSMTKGGSGVVITGLSARADALLSVIRTRARLA